MKNRGKEENQEGFCTLPLLTDNAGYATGYEVWRGAPESLLSIGPEHPRYATGCSFIIFW